MYKCYHFEGDDFVPSVCKGPVPKAEDFPQRFAAAASTASNVIYSSSWKQNLPYAQNIKHSFVLVHYCADQSQ